MMLRAAPAGERGPGAPVTGWGTFSNDANCLAGASITGGPGALIRGGRFTVGRLAGPLAVDGRFQPSGSGRDIGFRCAREL